ncbi:MAG: hypothetical protein AAB353_04020 [Candidatus Hydrogenedentota bacterium]|mgnify:CR=1 FL=1
MSAVKQSAAALLSSRRFPYVAATLAVVLCLPALSFGFFADDYMHRAMFLQPVELSGMFGHPFPDMFTLADGDPERMHRFVDKGLYPWLTLPELKFRFMRTVAVVTHWIDYALWPNSPALMHVHNLLWFGALVVAVAFYYRRMIGPGITAGLAALIFAIDDAHAWPAAWIANRNEMIALLLGVLVMTCHDRSRQSANRPAALAASVLFAVALFTKESAISICGYLFAYAIFLDKSTAAKRILSLAPYAAITVLWRAYYVYAGYGSFGSQEYVDPVAAPVQFARALIERTPILLQGLWGLPPSDLYSIGPSVAKPYVFATGVIGIVVVAALLTPLLRRDPLARFFAVGMLLAIVPIVAAGPQDRLLMFATLGSSGLLAQLLVAVHKRELFDSPTRRTHRCARGMYYAFIAIHLVLAPILLPGTIYAVDEAGNSIMDISVKGIPTGPEVQDKTIVLTNFANYPAATYLYIVRGLSGAPTPAHVRSLAPPLMYPVPIWLTRTDERTIVAEPDGGYPWSLFRDADHPLAAGQRIELTGMTVEVLALSEEGWPARVAYHFDKPLEDPSLLWFRIEGVELPPTVGETIYTTPFGVSNEARAPGPLSP